MHWRPRWILLLSKKFEERFLENYDVADDVLYTTWVKLKNAVQPQNSGVSHLDTNPIPELKSLSLAGPSIDEVLQHPKAKKKVTRGHGMPSHLTGEQVMQYLTEKERMKKEAEEALLKSKEE